MAGRHRGVRYLNSRAFGCLMFLIYACLTIISAIHHVPFYDETDPWTFARDSNWEDFRRYFAYSGHPPLWHMVLLPFARLGFSASTLAVINTLFALAVAWLLLFHSRLPQWLNVLVLFSAGIGFQYAVFERGYMLMILVMFSIAALYPYRMKKPKSYGLLLGMLFNTEVFSIIPAAVLAVFFTLECVSEWKRPDTRPDALKRYVPAILLAAMGAAIALLALWPPPDIQEHYRGLILRYPDAMPVQMIDGFWSLKKLPIKEMDYYWPLLSAPLMLDALLAIMFASTRWLLLLLCTLAWLYFIFTFKWYGWYIHGWLIPVYQIWIVWLYSHNPCLIPWKQWHYRVKRGVFALLALLFGLSCYKSGHERWIDYNLPASGGKDMAMFIRSHGYEDRLILSMDCAMTSGVSAWLPHAAFWLMGENRYASYEIWNHTLQDCYRVAYWVSPTLVHALQERPDMLVLSGIPLSIPEGFPLHLLHMSRGHLKYFLYIFQPRELPPGPGPAGQGK